MKTLVLFAFSALSVMAQPIVYGKLTISGPAVTRKLAGKSAKQIMLGNLNVCATANTAVSTTDVEIHVSAVNFMNNADAINIITSSYNNQGPQRLINDATLASGAIGAAAALRAGLTSLPVVGAILAGVSFLQTEVGPMLLANQAPLASILANQLTSMGTNGVVQVGPQNCITNARVFVTMSSKTAPSVQNFSFVPGTAPTTLMLPEPARKAQLESPVNTDSLNGLVAANVARSTPVEPVRSEPSSWEAATATDPWRVVTVVAAKPADAPPICGAAGVHCEPASATPSKIEVFQKQLDSLKAAVNSLQAALIALTPTAERLGME